MQPRKFYHEEYQAVCVESKNYYNILQDEEDEEDEENYYSSPLTTQIACVGTGLGGGHTHSSELKTLNYPEAMASDDKEEWMHEIDVEDDRMNKYEVWDPVPIDEVPSGTKPLTSTWVFKKKSSGRRRGRLNAHGFKQIEGVHYNKDDIAYPVTNEVTIRVVMVMSVVLRLCIGLIDVKGAFLQGEFEKNDKDLCMKVPQGLEDKCPDNVYLKLLAPIYGLKMLPYYSGGSL